MTIENKTPQNPDKIKKMLVSNLRAAENCCLKNLTDFYKGRICRECSGRILRWIVACRWLMYAEHPDLNRPPGHDQAKLLAIRLDQNEVGCVFVLDDRPGEQFYGTLPRSSFDWIMPK